VGRRCSLTSVVRAHVRVSAWLEALSAAFVPEAMNDVELAHEPRALRSVAHSVRLFARSSWEERRAPTSVGRESEYVARSRGFRLRSLRFVAPSRRGVARTPARRAVLVAPLLRTRCRERRARAFVPRTSPCRPRTSACRPRTCSRGAHSNRLGDPTVLS
jgi:hypothetical protein